MTDPVLIEIGKRIQGKRKILKLSQEGLAEKAEISKQTVSRAENGQRELGARNVARIAAALEVSADYLLTGKRNDTDIQLLNQKANALTDRQFNCLDEMIRVFVGMCETESK